MEDRSIVGSESRTRASRGIATDKPWVTALFNDRDQAEEAYQSLAARGYDVQDINLVMSDDTRKKYFSSDQDTELGNKAAKGAGVGGAIGGTLGAIAAAVAAGRRGAPCGSPCRGGCGGHHRRRGGRARRRRNSGGAREAL